MKNLLIIGAGQYGMVAKEIAESMKCFEKIDFVDDVYPSTVGKICDINKLIHEWTSSRQLLRLRQNRHKNYSLNQSSLSNHFSSGCSVRKIDGDIIIVL